MLRAQKKGKILYYINPFTPIGRTGTSKARSRLGTFV